MCKTAELCQECRTFLEEEGVDGSTYQTHLVKTRLTELFKEHLSFHRLPKKNEAEFVYSSSVNPGPLIEKCYQQAAEAEEEALPESVVDAADLAHDTTCIYTAAMILRQKLLSVERTMPFPPLPVDLDEANVKNLIPPALYNFLCWLLFGDESIAPIDVENFIDTPNASMHQRALSVAQDLIFIATQGLIKTPKHVSLPIAIKHITGSVQAVPLLNRFGHCISESQLREYDTAMAERQLQVDHPAFFPRNIQAGARNIILCWDITT